MKYIRSSLVVLLTLAVAGCGTPQRARPDAESRSWARGSNSASLGAGVNKLLTTIGQNTVQTDSQRRIVKALELVRDQKLELASNELNAALKQDPANSLVQMLNAFVYQLMAWDGDTTKLQLAEQGYLLSLQFDKSNWVAHYLLGMLYFEQRDFKSAQKEMAEVLLFVGEDEEVLFRMVASSYYAGDPVTASACLDRLRALNPEAPSVLRLSAIVSAAIGQSQKAEEWLRLYQAASPSAADLERLRVRVQHWNLAHRNSSVNTAQATRLPVQFGGAPPSAAGGGGMFGAAAGAGAGTASGFGGPPANGAGFSGFGGALGAVAPVGTLAAGGNRMVLVDVVIMRTEDSLSTRKGINLLSALSVQFGQQGSTVKANTNGTTTTANDGGSYSGATTANTTSDSTTVNLTRAINIPMLTYSLNIANSNTDLNEVLARPTLAALEGVQSQFFSGTTLNAAVVSNSTQSGSSVQIEKEIGVKFAILPVFMPDNKIRLTVDAQRTFLKPPNANIEFTYKLETSKIMLNANVVMEFGETLVLGGLSEKETNYTRDGVPLLQDVPGLQYLFSSRNESNFQRSVLMLITPRLPLYTYRKDDNAAKSATTGSSSSDLPGDDVASMKELRARYGDWFKPYPNLASVFNHLNSSSIYREFRTGDVTMEKWDQQTTTLQRLQQALEFLFY